MEEGTFERALADTLRWEGGLSKDPVDPGGTTNMGISQRAHPEVDVENLTLAQAREIYRHDYWLAARCEEYPAKIRGKVFDMTVNMGPTQAVKIVQEACNRLGEQLTVDGKLGRLTLAACDYRKDAGLLTAIRIEASLFYRRLAASRPSLQKYLNGWLRRAAS